jgi:uncharacterized repeat protein (TIGR01451 family)
MRNATISPPTKRSAHPVIGSAARLLSLVLLGAAGLTAAASPAGAATCAVTNTAGLVSQLTNASCSTIDLAAGTYSTPGGFDVARNVTLVGPTNGTAAVLSASGSVVTVGPVTATLQGLTIQGGTQGITNAGALTLSVVTIVSNKSTGDGGGIFTNGSALAVSHSLIENDSAAEGGGVYVASGTVTITGSSFSNDSAGSGGAIYNAGGTVTLSTDSIANNSATGTGADGGGIYNGAGAAGGGIYNGAGRSLSLSGTQVQNDTATGTGAAGGGIYNGVGGSVTITTSQLTGNAGGTEGGAIYGGPNGSVSLTGSVVSANSATNGGGIYSDCGATTATSSTVLVGNTPNNLFQATCHGALTITKTDNDHGSSAGTVGSAAPGSAITYTIVVSNSGPSTATDALVNDPLPAALSSATWSTAVADGASATPPSGVGSIVKDSLILPAGGSVTYTLTGTIAVSASGTLSNTATVSPPNGFSDTSTSSSATDTDSLAEEADLTITKVVNNGTPNVGSDITYTIEVSNLGPSNAPGTTVSDLLPVGLSFVSDTAPAGSAYNSNTGVWSIGTVTVGQTDTLTITAEVTGEGTLTNTATVSTTATDTNPSDTASASVTPVDLTITKSDSGGGSSATGATGVAVAGSQLTYTVVVANTGPGATTATLSDPLSASILNDTWSVATTGGASATTISGLGAIASDALSLPGDSSVTFTITGTVALSASGTISNSATLTPSGGSPTVVTDSDDVLTLTKTDSDGGSSPTAASPSGVTGSVTAGGAVTYDVTIVNTSTSSVTGSLADTLPPSIIDDSWTVFETGGASASKTSGTGNISADVTLPGDSSITFAVTGLVASDATGTISNTATLTPTGGSAMAVTDTDDVNAEADLTITKTDSDGGSSVTDATGTAVPGDEITYTLVVTNEGPSNAFNVAVADTLPSQGLSDVASPNVPAGVSFNAAFDTWTIGTLAAGASDALTLTGTVPAGATGSYTNTATASASDTTSNVTATDTDSLSPGA